MKILRDEAKPHTTIDTAQARRLTGIKPHSLETRNAEGTDTSALTHAPLAGIACAAW